MKTFKEEHKNNSHISKINLNINVMSKTHYLKYGTHYRKMLNDSSTYTWFVMQFTEPSI